VPSDTNGGARTDGVDYRGKRVLDVTFALVAIVVTLPVQAAVALAVRISSPGPVVHRAVRVGRHGRPFVLYKFRSMREDPARHGPLITARGDARITKVGAVLRRSKLDELPQLYNVLKGDMSTVGPRPEDQRYVDRYNAHQRRILSWRPGITSPASLAYREEETLLADVPDLDVAYASIMSAKLEIDLEYLERATLLEDIRCVIATLASVIGARRTS
jgi:lipopolysaccharide/colanic/teichoic acid biosynthesis glycosyltransferase